MNRININNLLLRTFSFLFFVVLGTSLVAQDKKVTIKKTSISIKDAFALIEKQTDYSIAYGQSKLELKKKIALSLTNVNIENALSIILKDTKHSYKIKGYHIIINPSEDKEQPLKEQSSSKLTQTIRGTVIDSKTGLPIESVSIGLIERPFEGTMTDSLGQFRLSNVPIGRYNLKAVFLGYETNIVSEILVSSSKEVNLEIPMLENMRYLDEVVITPTINKGTPLNQMALTGGRMISMEEASRFANGFDDPARLVSAFAGVAGNVGSNAIAVRGNSPQFMQWRLEGVEIPNPTHFADIGGLGGGFLSGLSSQVMGNSDFYNGGFPAEYSNALSGVFDMHMRNGNNQKNEHTFQAGLMGFDLASEGPISKKHGSSYIFNYRFSSTSLVTNNDVNMKYQDVSFKLNFPTKKLGIFSIWGLGLIDRNKNKEEENQDDWETNADRQSSKINLDKMLGGLSHKYIINETTSLKTSLAATYSQDRTFADQLTTNKEWVKVGDIQNKKWDIVFSSSLNKKFSSKHINRSGISITGLKYELDYKVSPDFGLDKPMERISKGNGNSTVVTAYSSSIIDLSDELSASIGLTAQYFALNENWAIEPRLALKWKMKPQHAVSISYGLHSRREKLDYYFVESEKNGQKLTNKYLDFSKAHHFGLAYDWNINSNLHLKVEPYFQQLYDIPVEENSSFSIINYQEFYLDRILVNKGKGQNYGIDITFEQYMNKGFYYMLTGSIFKSRYKGGDNIWRNTRLDRGYIFNALAGKEWMVGKQKQNMFSVNARLFIHGGDRYTPLDEKATHESKDIEWDETRAFSKKFNPAVNGDISVNYKINKRKISHEFSLKVLNVGFYMGTHFYQYNEKTNTIKKEKGSGLIPNISYKIYF